MTQSMRVICCFRRRSMLSATPQRQPSAAHRTAVQTFYSATAEAHTATDSVINSYHVSRWRLTVHCGRHRLSIGHFDSACFYKQWRAFCLMRQHRGRQTTTTYGPTTALKKSRADIQIRGSDGAFGTTRVFGETKHTLCCCGLRTAVRKALG